MKKKGKFSSNDFIYYFILYKNLNKFSILKQAPLNLNTYKTDLENNRTQDITGRQNSMTGRQDSLNNNPLGEQPQNSDYGNNEQTDCFGKVKNLYTNPETPCQNIILISLSILCVVVTCVVLYSFLARG